MVAYIVLEDVDIVDKVADREWKQMILIIIVLVGKIGMIFPT